MVPNVVPDAFLTLEEISTGYGHALDDTIREYGVFHESALVHMPKNLSFEQASTLTCSGLTVWNALFGGGEDQRKGTQFLLRERVVLMLRLCRYL
jgi:NADPH:quinone reductase-like Zn-dependent oxidoreductase